MPDLPGHRSRQWGGCTLIERRGMLDQALRRSLDCGWPVWLLIDPLVREPLPLDPIPPSSDAEQTRVHLAQARAQAWGRQTFDVPLSPHIKLAPHHWPYLVELQGRDDIRLVDSLQWAQREQVDALANGFSGSGRALCTVAGWIQTSADIGALRRGLADSMRLRTEASTPARYLRLADRRTLDWLIALMGRPRLVAALQPVVQRWLWLDSLGRLARLDDGLENDRHIAPQPLVLDHVTWADFQHARWVHPALARWLGEHRQRERTTTDGSPDADVDLDRVLQALLVHVKDALAVAQRHPHKFPADDDLVAWAALRRLQPGLAGHPAVAEWLRQPEEDSFNLQCHELLRTAALPLERPTP